MDTRATTVPAGRGAVLAEVDALLAALEQPLPAAERAAGWDEETRAQYHLVFVDLRARLLDPRPLGPGERLSGIGRSFEMAGICGGALRRAAVRISNATCAIE